MTSPRLFCVLPAGGSGRRVGADRPKQYLPIAGRPLLRWTLDAVAHVNAARTLVIVAVDDAYVEALNLEASNVEVVRRGGASRADTVRAALDVLASDAEEQDWVLVHDAARPCVSAAELDRLLAALADDPVGGLLALPVQDTVKQAPAGEAITRVDRTIDRDTLWLAQTPQMFRFGVLRDALRDRDTAPTDEAGAVERLGQQPVLVVGSPSNLKVTRQEDLELASFWLQRHGRVASPSGPACAPGESA